MHLFKYLEPTWADRMVYDGSVRVGTLYDFRRIESLGAERGDGAEGVRISLTDGRAGTIEGKDLPWFVRESLQIPPGVKFQFAEGAVLKVHQNAADAYVFCTCKNFDKTLMQRFGGACVEITDTEQYFRAITIGARWLDVGRDSRYLRSSSRTMPIRGSRTDMAKCNSVRSCVSQTARLRTSGRGASCMGHSFDLDCSD